VDCFFSVPDEASRTRLEIYGSGGSILTEGTVGQGAGGSVELLTKADAGGYDATQNKDTAAKFKPVRFRAIDPYAAECEYLVWSQNSAGANGVLSNVVDGRRKKDGVSLVSHANRAPAPTRKGYATWTSLRQTTAL